MRMVLVFVLGGGGVLYTLLLNLPDCLLGSCVFFFGLSSISMEYVSESPVDCVQRMLYVYPDSGKKDGKKKGGRDSKLVDNHLPSLLNAARFQRLFGWVFKIETSRRSQRRAASVIRGKKKRAKWMSAGQSCGEGVLYL